MRPSVTPPRDEPPRAAVAERRYAVVCLADNVLPAGHLSTRGFVRSANPQVALTLQDCVNNSAVARNAVTTDLPNHADLRANGHGGALGIGSIWLGSGQVDAPAAKGSSLLAGRVKSVQPKDR